MTRALVVGYGSIGTRHARVLAQLGVDVAVVSRRANVPGKTFASLERAVEFSPDYVVVANETGRHFETMKELGRLTLGRRVMVEKPLFAADAEPPPLPFEHVWVGYCLRFHPAVQALVEQVNGGKLFTFQATVGQHLSEWRPGSDHRAGYSARAGEGGALRDLSHELDLLHLVGGRARAVVAQVQTVGDLEIASDDCASLLVEAERCSHAVIHLNLLERPARRELVVTGSFGTVAADLVGGSVRIGGGERRRTPVERDALFAAQHRAALEGDTRWLCPLADARATLRLIDAAERSMRTRSWERVR